MRGVPADSLLTLADDHPGLQIDEVMPDARPCHAPLVALCCFGEADAQATRSFPWASFQGLLSAREHNPELVARAAWKPEANWEQSSLGHRLTQVPARDDDFTNTVSAAAHPCRQNKLGRPATASSAGAVLGQTRVAQRRGRSAGGAEIRVADRTALEIEARIKTAYAITRRTASPRFLARRLRCSDGLSRLVETRYSVGLVPQQDAIRAQRTDCV